MRRKYEKNLIKKFSAIMWSQEPKSKDIVQQGSVAFVSQWIQQWTLYDAVYNRNISIMVYLAYGR